MALVTVEVCLTDVGEHFAFASPDEEEARAMGGALAARLGVEPAPPGCVLPVSMTAAELKPIVLWIHEQFPTVGFTPCEPREPDLAGAVVPAGTPFHSFETPGEEVVADVPTTAFRVDFGERFLALGWPMEKMMALIGKVQQSCGQFKIGDTDRQWAFSW
jgi:hypothetical protein